jgi:tRNA pseudouridine55 synthase
MSTRSYRSNAPRPVDPCDGVLLVDKPGGFTSHDVVAKIRGHFGFKKVGHGGTLDPMATGLLVILLGRGTKLSQRIMGGDKTYEGTMRLGVTTDSQDAEGKILREADASHITRDMLESAMQPFTGDIMQTPPMVSAIKKNGVPLYKLARKGKTVEREPRLIHVYEFSLLDYVCPCADFRLRSTKGTYVRTICHDTGETLGCGAHLAALRRTRSGSFSVTDALPLEDLIALSMTDLQRRIIPVNQVMVE